MKNAKMTVHDIINQTVVVKENVEKKKKKDKKRKIARKDDEVNSSVNTDDQYDVDEVDPVKVLVRNCINAANDGAKERTSEYPSAKHSLFSASNPKQYNTVLATLKCMSLGNNEAEDFFYFAAKDWYMTHEKFLEWQDGGKREVSLTTILNEVDLFIGLYNDHRTNPAAMKNTRLRPSLKAKMMKVTTYNRPMTFEQQMAYVEMILMNIGAYEPYCPFLDKLTKEQKDILEYEYCQFKMKDNELKREEWVAAKSGKSFNSWKDDKYQSKYDHDDLY